MNLYARRRALLGTASSGSPTVHGTWEDLFARIADGTYATAYSVGEILPLDLGTHGAVDAQIVAFNSDDKADGSGKAPVTLVFKNCTTTTHRYNPQLSGSSGSRTIGTGCIGGWEHSELRTYVSGTLLPLIPSDIRARIVPVKKYSKIANSDETYTNNVETTDSLWCLSYREVYNGNNSAETIGPYYSSRFTNNSSRVIKNPSGTVKPWWLRSANNAVANTTYVTNSGGNTTYGQSTQPFNIVCGFCVG